VPARLAQGESLLEGLQRHDLVEEDDVAAAGEGIREAVELIPLDLRGYGRFTELRNPDVGDTWRAASPTIPSTRSTAAWIMPSAR